MDLRFPGEIDAHLSCAALDGAEVVLAVGDEEVQGRFDLSDGFGLVTFLHQGGVWRPRQGAEVRASYRYQGRIWEFVTRVGEQVSWGRWHLRRPRHIIAAAAAPLPLALSA